jgi:hypothetical protein
MWKPDFPRKKEKAMAVFYEEMKNGKYLVRETEPGIKLQFTGVDADRFEQVDVPENGQLVEFALTVKQCQAMGVLPLSGH